jgi:hypothetical protein
MAQHDYVIDNQASAAARADLNSLFQAIASQNSGATAPTTTYANMIWYDTANDLLKMRNEANSGWITLGTVDQTNNVFNPNFLPATQAEAEAGTNNVKGMTALRVAQAITALNPAAGVNIQVFTATGTYTPTSGYKYGIAFVTGGGGGTQGTSNTSNARAGSGGGATAIGVLNLTTLGAVTATVGAAGVGGASGTGHGSDGGSSTLSSLTGGGGQGSAGGGSGGTASGGIINIEGGFGANAFTTSSGGLGGGSFWGGPTKQSQAATLYGNGGGGRNGSTTSSGFSGAAGVIMIMEFK